MIWHNHLSNSINKLSCGADLSFSLIGKGGGTLPSTGLSEKSQQRPLGKRLKSKLICGPLHHITSNRQVRRTSTNGCGDPLGSVAAIANWRIQLPALLLNGGERRVKFQFDRSWRHWIPSLATSRLGCSWGRT